MKPILLFILSALTLCGYSQQRTTDVAKSEGSGISPNNFMVVGGTPFVNTKFTRLVAGSPYFSDDWMKGNVQLSGGKEYTAVIMKLDLIDNNLHYKDPAGNEMVAASDLQKVVLADTVAQRMYTFVFSSHINTGGTTLERGWYQLLSEVGDAAIFKRITKTVTETKPYGTATYEQEIKTSYRYFVLYKNNLTAIKKIKEVSDILSDKKNELAQFISSHDLKGKADEDYESLMQHYATLKQ